MADLTAKAPFEAQKVHELHDQSLKPAKPESWEPSYRKYLGWPLLAVLLTIGGCAVVFQFRDAWDSHRDWVPPAAIQGMAPGAVALAYLSWRGRFGEMWIGATLLFVALGLLLADWMVSVSTDNYPRAEDALTIIGAIVFGGAVVALVIGMIVAEVRSPVKAPQPEL